MNTQKTTTNGLIITELSYPPLPDQTIEFPTALNNNQVLWLIEQAKSQYQILNFADNTAKIYMPRNPYSGSDAPLNIERMPA